MSEIYEKAKEIARQLVDLEITRKSAVDEQKTLKEELIAICEENPIDRSFEFTNGLVMLDETVTHKICDGLLEETKVESKSPEQLSNDFLETYFQPSLKLSKRAKEAIKEEDNELLSVLVPERKTKVKIVI